ncbi:MAG: hypothetical protein RLY97_1661 [Pseudomonadota bacterium]
MRADTHSPFLSRAMARLPELVDILAAGQGEAALDWSKCAGADAPSVAYALRRERLALALTLAIGDLAGAFSLERVMAELSAFADRALDAAIADAIVRRVPGATPAGFTALALGKHGAGELNYSSDIDPILLYDPVLLPRRSRDDAGEAAEWVARAIVQTLGHVDAEGYVFRVDLRLRPASEVSPLAIPFEAALGHYESSALAWERAAFIRARSAAGDVAAGDGFLAAIRPFVWRKSLDYGAIAEIGRLTQRIRASHGGAAQVGPGFDLKKGRGGIREIEFFAQTHQLIHGGRHPELRLRGTRASLDALAAGGFVADDDARMMGMAYDRLRVIEHRLQMVNDQQTHALPRDWADLDAVAHLHGSENGAALVAELAAICEAVGARYDQLILQQSGVGVATAATAVAHGGALVEQLAEMGYAAPESLAARIDGWRGGTMRALRSGAAIAAWDALQTPLLVAVSHAPDRDRALLRWEQLIGQTSSVVTLLRLLVAQPKLLELLVRILSLAPPLADELARRADLLDALLDASAFALPLSVTEMIGEFSDWDEGADYQQKLDHVRRKVGEKRFALGVQLIEAAHDPLDISAALSRVAEAAIAVLTKATTVEFQAAHGAISGGELVILGLGRLGGGALTHASDLDLIFLFTGDFAVESDGRRPLNASLYFNRLAQRVSAALSVPTAEGALYEVDTRLRPQGTQGMLAVNFASFAKYQQEAAWSWEHMALTRARVVYGSQAARKELAGMIRGVLLAPRDAVALHDDVLAMRARMAENKAPKGALDVKLLRGGLVDAEFMVHYIQLRDGVGLQPDLRLALEELAAAGMILDAALAAFDLMARFLVAARLLAPDCAVPPPVAQAALAKVMDCSDWAEVMAKLRNARTAIAADWARIFAVKLELDQ